MAGMPARGADQAPITRMLEEWKVGRALRGDASVADLRAAAHEVLTTPSYTEEARRLSKSFAGLDGATLAADSVDAALFARGD